MSRRDPDPELSAAAREFARDLKDLLNRTVCVGAHVGSLVAPDDRAVVCTRLDTTELESRPVPLMTFPSSARCWLQVSYRLYRDPRGYLTCQSSAYTVHAGPNAEHELFHFDYERDKESYTEAHLQVVGESEPLRDLMASLGQPKRTLRHLHFPVGGRRFRVSLEDVLEFLINEGLVRPADGWRGVLDLTREAFREKQLKAAIARKPDVAVEILGQLGYKITPPPEEKSGGKLVKFPGSRSRRQRR